MVPVFENGAPKDEALCAKLDSLLSLLGGSMNSIRRAYWINNPLLANQFEIFLGCNATRHQLNPTAFNSRDWESAPADLARKRQFLAMLDTKLVSASKVLGTSEVISVIQGTSENAAHRIAKNGFGILATGDAGFFGQGIYFTSKLNYARKYSDLKPATDGSQVLVISLAAPGNVLPISADPYTGDLRPNPQGYLGKPLQRGYQSHYTAVSLPGEGGTYGYPLRTAPTEASSDELVVFEPSQALPVFLIYLDPAKSVKGPFFCF